MRMNRVWFLACVISSLAVVGCDKKQDEQQAAEVEQNAVQENAPTAVKSHVSENDMYLKKLETEITIDDPDSLIEDVNEKVGDNHENAEKARQNAVTGARH